MSLVVINIIALICTALSNTNKDTKPIANTIENISIPQTRIVTTKTKPIVTCMPTTAVTTTNTITTIATHTTKTDGVIEKEIITRENDKNYCGRFEATYYEGDYGTYGASGRDLISGYSIASNISF